MQTCMNNYVSGFTTSTVTSSMITLFSLKRNHSAGHNVRQTSLDVFSDLVSASASRTVLGERQELVYLTFKKLCDEFGDATDMEVTKYLFENGYIKRFDPNFVRPRRYELEKQLKLLEESNVRSCRVTARTVTSFKLKIKGEDL